MATKAKKQAVIEAPQGDVAGEEEISVEEEATSQRSWEAVRAQLDATLDAGVQAAAWRVTIPYVAREIERLSGQIKQDEAAILDRLHETKERPAQEQRFKRIGDLARATRYVWRRAQRQQSAGVALSGDQYRALLAQVRGFRRVFFAQAPLLVSMGLMELRELDALRVGSGPTDHAQDVEDFVELYTAHWDKIEPLQPLVFSKEADRVSAQGLKEAAAAALKLTQHIGSDATPATSDVDWSAQLLAACHLLRSDWEAICHAAEYHYKRAGQPDKIKALLVSSGAMRRKK